MAPNLMATPARDRSRDGVYDLFIVALTLFSLLVVVVYYLLPLSEATLQTLLWIDIPISLIFLLDSIRSLRLAPHKGAYLKWGWLDFLGSVPLILPLRIARLARLIRAVRTLHLRRLKDVGQDLDQNRAQGAALIMVLLAIVVVTTSTVAVLEFESEMPGANIRSGGDAFWWSIVTMATVGYGDFYPITAWGRIAAVALMTVGVGIFGVLASFLANLFLPQSVEEETSDLDELRDELAALNARLAAIETLLGERTSPAPGEPEDRPGPAPADDAPSA